MRFSDSYLLWAGVAFLANFGLASAAEGSFHTRPRDYDSRDYYALQLDGRDPEAVAKHFGLQHEGVIGELRGHHLFSTEKAEEHVDVVKRHIEHFQARRRKREPIPEAEAALYDSIKFNQKQQLKKLHKRLPPKPKKEWLQKRASKRQDLNSVEAAVGRPVDSSMIKLQKIQKTLGIEDPIFKDQWHLLNYRSPGHDVNVTGLWLEGITGKNATVSIVDDGLDMYSNDLKDNYFAAGSYDFNDHQAEPRPRLSDDRHGTRCAGEIAAVKNDVCGVGVAYDAKVSGIRILSKLITDADEAVALNYAFNENHIYSCSWGPPDDGQQMDEPGILIKRAIVNGINEGRDGKGSVFVFATGNGAASGDNCNFDGYTNSIYSITVGAIDHKGLHPYYSEECSAQLVVTYSSGSGESIHTTDVSQGGADRCYDKHGGTSAAAPLAAGIYALVLSVRPDLTWRDLQYLTVQTAVMVEEEDEDWITTHAGYKYNHKFGYGKLDAYRLVHAAMDFKTVKPQAWYHSPVLAIGQSIPENDQGLISTFTVTKEMLEKANLEKIEHVTVKMNLRHGRRGDVSVDLVSPNGIISKIAVPREDDRSQAGYKDWTFMSVVHWGEDGVGEWKIVTRDTLTNGKTGTLDNWQLNLWGPSIDPAKAVKHPLPGDKEHEQPTDDDHSASTSQAPVHTTTLPAAAKPVVPTKPATEPTVDRPTPSKPEGLSSTPSSTPTSTPTTDTKPTDAATAIPADKRPGMIPSFLPTFGVSGTKQAWIYASAGFIGLFVAGLGIFMCVQKRKRAAQNSRDDYEFAVLENEDEMALTGGAGQGKEKTKKKARDLYDAFGASDDEDVLSDSEDEKGYRDESGSESESEGSPSGSR